MDETTFRILDALSRQPAGTFSINQLTKRIQEFHGSAYYANIYEKLQALAGEGIISLSKAGKSTIATMNLKQHPLIDLLAEMELRKKRDLLRNEKGLQMLLMGLDTYLNDLIYVSSASLIDPKKNAKLNRAELLVLSKDSNRNRRLAGAAEMHRILQSLQTLHNTRIDHLMLGKEGLVDMLSSDERNPLKEMLSNKITVFSPQAFWLEMKAVLEKGIQIRIEEDETNPAKISERDLTYNLARFGYKELGREIKEGENICIEYIIASILLRNDARRTQAIPIILAKNGADYNLLVFLCRKYGVGGRLLGLLKVLNKIKSAGEAGEAVKILEAMKTKEVKVDEKSIREKMRLYDVA